MNQNAQEAAIPDTLLELWELMNGREAFIGARASLAVGAEPRPFDDGMIEPEGGDARFQALVDTLPVQFCTLRPDGSVEYESGEWRHYTGIARRAQSTWTWQEILHPDDLHAFLGKWQDVRLSASSGVVEARFKRLDGQFRWFRTSMIPQRTGKGRIARWYISNVDIDELKLLRSREPAAPDAADAAAPRDIARHPVLTPVSKAPEAAGDAQLARAQLEALTRTVEALATEASPDRLIEHVLRTITTQFNAHSCAVWTRHAPTNRIGFECALEAGEFIARHHPKMERVSPWIPSESHWPCLNLFRTGLPEFIENVITLPQFDMRDHLIRIGVVSVQMIPMSIAATITGGIGIRFSDRRVLTLPEIELAQALANHAMLALQLAKLYAESRASAITAERNRLARDIHDTIAQGFTGVIIQLEASADARAKSLPTEADAHIERAKDLARTSLQEARRSVRAWRPLALVQCDWYRALSSMFEKMTQGTSMRVDLSLHGEQRPLPLAWDENLMRIGQEALTNSIRHARASKFHAQVAFLEQQLVFDLQDDGQGFDTQGRFEGYGLTGIRERVNQMRGSLEVRSSRGNGSNLRITLPLQ